jgi:hypothetical protein
MMILIPDRAAGHVFPPSLLSLRHLLHNHPFASVRPIKCTEIGHTPIEFDARHFAKQRIHLHAKHVFMMVSLAWLYHNKLR